MTSSLHQALENSSRPSSTRDYIAELGVSPVLNASGTYTKLTGSLMPPEVTEAWQQAAQNFFRLDEVHDAVGKRIASLVGAQAAMVPAGAASALTLGTAACLTGSCEGRIHRLPDTSGMPNQVIIQKSHRFNYDHAVRNCGTTFVEVETPEQLRAAVNSRSAMLLFFNAADPPGQIDAADFARLGRELDLPTFIDCAGDVPPVENLSRFLKLGFDLVAFSGGKAIQGPQSTGLLMGRRDLIEAARLNTLPNSDTIGRGMKVNKEEMLALLVALELYLERDHEQDWQLWEEGIQTIDDRLQSVLGVETESYVPAIANHTPHLRIRWDQEQIPISLQEAITELGEGEPSIEVVPETEELEVTVWMLQTHEVQLVADRIAEVFESNRLR